MTNKKHKKVIAIDLGASTGRALLGSFDGNKINVEEIHRFTNEPVFVNDTLYWDVLRIFHEIKKSLIIAKSYGEIESISIDTWGVDFGLLDVNGNLMANPVHYRDQRTNKMVENAFLKMSPEEIYQENGNQIMKINTLFQLLALQHQGDTLKQAKTLLFMPDLFNYFLTNEKIAEISIASTSQMLNSKTKNWSKKICDSLQIPQHLLAPIVKSGTKLGPVKKEICDELGINAMQVIAGAGHDTQSAMLATPSEEEDFIFLSSGTWSLLGTEVDEPIINPQTQKLNLTNEIGYDNKTSFLKNIMGLWLIQECRKQWAKEGKEYSFAELEDMAKEEKPFTCFVDPDDKTFSTPGNMPMRIQEYAKKTKQAIPMSDGAIVRCINESLSLKYRQTIEEIQSCTNKDYHILHIVGGGCQSEMLCQMSANATNCIVHAGPVEAAILGNVAIQLLANNDISSVKDSRKIIRQSLEVNEYYPMDKELWQQAYMKFMEVTKC